MTGRTGKIIMAAALLWALVLPAGADLITNSETDTTYSGALDTRTGLPVTGETGGSGSEEGPVKLLGDGSYGFDRARQMFICYAGETSFYASVPPGIVLPRGQDASFELPDGVTGVLYRNGDPVDGADLSAISETGSYILQVQGGGIYDSFSLQFVILGSVTGTLVDYTLPGSFTFTSVSINGEQLTAEYTNYIQFLEEGSLRCATPAPTLAAATP